MTEVYDRQFITYTKKIQSTNNWLILFIKLSEITWLSLVAEHSAYLSHMVYHLSGIVSWMQVLKLVYIYYRYILVKCPKYTGEVYSTK